jgi:hypothetical protein
LGQKKKKNGKNTSSAFSCCSCSFWNLVCNLKKKKNQTLMKNKRTNQKEEQKERKQ